MASVINRESVWNEITNMTQCMLVHARSGEWNTVIEIESQRQNKMQAFFHVSSPLNEVHGIVEGITTVMRLDKEIMDLGKSDINKFGNSLEQINRGKKAQFAYQKLA